MIKMVEYWVVIEFWEMVKNSTAKFRRQTDKKVTLEKRFKLKIRSCNMTALF